MSDRLGKMGEGWERVPLQQPRNLHRCNEIHIAYLQYVYIRTIAWKIGTRVANQGRAYVHHLHVKFFCLWIMLGNSRSP